MTVLMTGFPGFLGSALLPGILERTDSTAICLVQPKFTGWQSNGGPAQRCRARHAGAHSGVRRRHHPARLGLRADALNDVTEAWHLAAAYDLAVDRGVAIRVNLEGTRNVLDAVERCPNLTRLHYFSTCYVSGRYAGPFGEDDLEVGAPFNNFYEETKHLAEADVRRRMSSGLPATIYRPSIVVGTAVPARRRSSTGRTSSCSGCCGSRATRYCRWSETRRWPG